MCFKNYALNDKTIVFGPGERRRKYNFWMNCDPRSYVGHLELPSQMIERLDGRVLGRMLRVDARGDRVDQGVIVGARKEGNRETGRGSRGRPGPSAGRSRS